ncbi:SDR family NAD(P)-dependent oxidoreductase [Halobacterium salinarum]|uniref:3-oxoacyl-[acyl-carrier-protein] reductase n=4 Tax=Halobacterium salinarum TaxID=2242 RepID=Q9HQ41_HALSA|nr:SDR family NAD(P)-dependent oxidoreductase [Halobacterium salinarum]AAG19676.1 3-oxoacyl-[acyl-carrier-protein] reductase [Halobacterium salinarum NRC-1]MBB6088678.1 3-oxoacyl-[acyl-carrier protein] reductase [Halobacterium salinarum]MDL0118914.1 SDR family NAD(P)-dependent oxidoreductase [Halobacterium salinarum]MDL0130026.1 SDR family NAD(P)-dependent oxidoreductase [Halobacterium salinarum]MDL0142081.1 SDR family NAD(P)-dependent oxidoreductase [Halobacterium salinarum]
MTDRSVVSGTAIVTGASSGIGRATAERLAADGARVVLCSRDHADVDAVADAIRTDGGTALPVECDVTDRDAVDALVEATVHEFGGLDVLVNNAGASFVAPFDDISRNGWDRIIDVNLGGTYNCTQAAAEQLKRDGGGAVVNVASVAGQEGSPHMSHYAAAKAGIITLTRTLAAEWAPAGVRVNCIAPGFVATPGLDAQMGVSAADIDRREVARRIGTSAEIADAIRFLASPAASFVVGETLTAAGVPQGEEVPSP